MDKTKRYKIKSESFSLERYYGISSVPYTFTAWKIKVDKFPNKQIAVYRANSGWIVYDMDTKTSYGKERAGLGWIGYDDKITAIENYIKQL